MRPRSTEKRLFAVGGQGDTDIAARENRRDRQTETDRAEVCAASEVPTVVAMSDDEAHASTKTEEEESARSDSRGGSASDEQQQHDDDTHTSSADLEAEVARLEAKLAERDEMMAECVAEGWDTSALEREMASLRERLDKHRATLSARAELAAMERAKRELRALEQAKQREIDTAEEALLKAATDPNREKRRSAIAAAEHAGLCRSETVQEAKRMDEQLAAEAAQKEAEAKAQEAKVMAWINAKSQDRDRRWGFEDEDEKWLQTKTAMGERLRERREYSLSNAAPLITDLFHALIRRMPDNPVAFCRHYMTMVRDASTQLAEYERNPDEYNEREQRLAEAAKMAALPELAETEASQEHATATPLQEWSQPGQGPEEEMPSEAQCKRAIDHETDNPLTESAHIDLIKEGTADDNKNAGALFGDLYGGGLLGGPLPQNQSHAYATGVTSYVAAHRRRARGGSYFDDLARSKVLDYSWGQHAKGRAAYSNDHEELFSITATRSAAASRESRRTVARGVQAARKVGMNGRLPLQAVELPPTQ